MVIMDSKAKAEFHRLVDFEENFHRDHGNKETGQVTGREERQGR